ncbi:sporulation protein [Bacillus sp. V3-13]|uniref:DUF1360 domain-containing protein n=1 Tax=Bacillus sp. V3-13 TaxID=2053728 RepID=UPI000C782859|nr:DUF1360 domain-containing protein [Bacillus sp. V3-13]PLR78798.1 sporulation protein [Bacillus sp. V3-13]
MNLDFWLIVIIGIASFRLTRLIVFDKITEFIRAPFFEEQIEEDPDGNKEIYLVPKGNGIRSWIGELLSCFWCTGVWSSLLLTVVYFLVPVIGVPVIFVLAVAAVGSVIEIFISKALGS